MIGILSKIQVRTLFCLEVRDDVSQPDVDCTRPKMRTSNLSCLLILIQFYNEKLIYAQKASFYRCNSRIG